MAHWPALNVPAGARVFAPFCGKSLDLRWLAERGHRVIGAELSELAVTAFFDEAGESPETETLDGFTRYTCGAIEILQGNFFALSRELVGEVAGVYDRGGLVALPEAMRRPYATQLMDLCGPGTTMLLLTIAYEGGPGTYPPFSVTDYEVELLYGARCRIECVEQYTNDAIPPRLQADGVREATHAIYRVSVR